MSRMPLQDETFRAFLERFGQTLPENADTEKTIYLVLSSDLRAQAVDLKGETPFACNIVCSTAVKVPERCIQLGFSEDESQFQTPAILSNGKIITWYKWYL